MPRVSRSEDVVLPLGDIDHHATAWWLCGSRCGSIHHQSPMGTVPQGIGESTWMYHLHRSDYLRWFRYAIKNDDLADETERVERRADLALRRRGR